MRLFPATPSKPASPARQKLRAAVARRAARAPSIEEDEEPTTSFKTALIVVVLLHLVAAGGVYMFDSIKTHRPALSEPASAVAPKTAAVVPLAAAKPTAAPAATPAEPLKKPAPAASTAAVAEVKDSGTLYTVAKGDNPVAIARRLHVGYDDLLKLNKIEDPKKLRIGQKLHIPVKARASAN